MLVFGPKDIKDVLNLWKGSKSMCLDEPNFEISVGDHLLSFDAFDRDGKELVCALSQVDWRGIGKRELVITSEEMINRACSPICLTLNHINWLVGVLIWARCGNDLSNYYETEKPKPKTVESISKEMLFKIDEEVAKIIPKNIFKQEKRDQARQIIIQKLMQSLGELKVTQKET